MKLYLNISCNKYLNMNSKDFEKINSSLLTLFNDKLKDILDSISKQYNINEEELYNQYIENYSKNKIKKKNIDSSNICMARKQDGNQCTRKKKNGDFCGKHEKHQKYGRIDDYNNLVEKLSQDDNYIMVWTESINNKEYLVDSNNIVYTKNLNSPEIIGKKKSNNLIEFINNS